MRRNIRGFTLIEVMIVVVIVAILASIAYPSYDNFIRKAKRATAQAALMEIAGKEQAYLLVRRVYTDDLALLGFAAPKEIENDYTFTFPGFDATKLEFVAQAEPSANLKAKGEVNLTVNHLGAKTPLNKPGYWGY